MVMPARFVNIDRNTPLLLPPDLRAWVPEDHLAHFILEAVEALNLTSAHVNERGTGDEQYPPRMLLALLCYCYATGTFSSRQIEQATYDHVPARFLSGDTHPDHDTICTFRRENQPLLEASFVRVLEMARELKLLKVGQITVSIDGTKVWANASKHAAVSYERAGEMVAQLELEVKALLRKAEAADSTPLEDGLTIPGEIARREQRKAALEKARAVIEQRARERAQQERPEYEKKVAARAAKKARGERVGGRDPKPPREKPRAKDQYNFTDGESRIMKTGNGEQFEQAYNAQAAVEVESRLIVAPRVTNAPNDKEQLPPTAAAIPAEVIGSVGAVLVDNGFYSEEAVKAVEANGQTVVYAAVEKTGHHRCVADLEKKADPPPPPAGASPSEIMRHRVRTREGKAKYRLRQQTVEPVFGIIKEAMGFRRFSLRGLAKVGLEWILVCLAYNLRRLHRMVWAVAAG
jgi:transposase